MNNITDTVKHLIIINILFFVGSELMSKKVQELIGIDLKELLSLHYFESAKFRFWQPLTHMFMHGGIMHIAFNMFALFSFGSMLENIFGWKKFLFFYISCGLGAALLHTGIQYFELQNVLNEISDLKLSDETLNLLLNANGIDGDYFRSDLYFKNAIPILENSNRISLLNEINSESLLNAAKINQSLMVGASGAIYGLLVAFAFMFPNAELMMMFIPVPIKAKYFVPGILVIDLILGLKGNSIFGGNGTGIAHFAHIGGALIGFLMMWFWKKNSFDNKRWN